MFSRHIVDKCPNLSANQINRFLTDHTRSPDFSLPKTALNPYLWNDDIIVKRKQTNTWLANCIALIN